MFTPQEVSEKTFPKASGFNNGYGGATLLKLQFVKLRLEQTDGIVLVPKL